MTISGSLLVAPNQSAVIKSPGLEPECVAESVVLGCSSSTAGSPTAASQFPHWLLISLKITRPSASQDAEIKNYDIGMALT